jgi:hypothetical protein
MVLMLPVPFTVLLLTVYVATKDLLTDRLGTDGKSLYLERADKGRVSVAPEEVVMGKNLAIIGQRVVMLRNGYRQSVFPPMPYEHYFKPLLERGRMLEGMALFKRLLELRHAPTLAPMVLVAVMGGFVLLSKAGVLALPEPAKPSSEVVSSTEKQQ